MILSNITLTKMPYFNSPRLFPPSGPVFLRLGRTWGEKDSFVKSVDIETTPKKFLGIELWRSRFYEVEEIPVKEKAVKILLDNLSLPAEGFKSEVAYLEQKFSQIIPQGELSELLQASSIKEPQSWYAETVLKKGRAYKALAEKLLETNDLWVQITPEDKPFRVIQDKQEITTILNKEINYLRLNLAGKFGLPFLASVLIMGIFSLPALLAPQLIELVVPQKEGSRAFWWILDSYLGLITYFATAYLVRDAVPYSLREALSEIKNLKMMAREEL